MNTSARRMEDASSLVTTISWDPFVDLPESIMLRFPDLREYNSRLRLRDEANRKKIEDELSKLQKAIDT